MISFSIFSDPQSQIGPLPHITWGRGKLIEVMI